MIYARPKNVKAILENAQARASEEELGLLVLLEPHAAGLGIAALAAESPGALEIVDRLVAFAEVTRFPGYLYAITPKGRRRLERWRTPAPESEAV